MRSRNCIRDYLRMSSLIVVVMLVGCAGSDQQELTTSPSESVDPTGAADSPLSARLLATIEVVADKTLRISWQTSAEVDFYRVLENEDGISGFTQIGEDLDSSTYEINHRVALYNRTNARYLVQACAENGCIDSEELMVAGMLTNGIGYIKGESDDRSFGFSSALSEDGSTLAVRSLNAVHVFFRSGDSWQTQTVLDAGGSVSLSADGNTLAVGRLAEGRGDLDINGVEIVDGSPSVGAVYVFVRHNGTWSQQARLQEQSPRYRHNFGASVSLSSDGNRLAVGTPRADNVAGVVYVFLRVGEVWEEEQRLRSSNPDQYDGNDTNSVHGDGFGSVLSLSGNGNTLAVAAMGEASSATGINGDQNDNSSPNKGAVYVFATNDDGWQQQAYVKASNTNNIYGFGTSISLSEDGNTMAVGGESESSASTGINGDQNLLDGPTGAGSGAAYVFSRNDGVWHQQAFVKASNTGYSDSFGVAVSLSADGNTLAVGANHEDSAAIGIGGSQYDDRAEAAGAVYLFRRTSRDWEQLAYIKASNTESGDAFGRPTLSADGNTLAVGAPDEDSAANDIGGNQNDNSAPDKGAVYLY